MGILFINIHVQYFVLRKCITLPLSVLTFIEVDQHSGVDLPHIFSNINCVCLLDAMMIKVNKDHFRFMQII